MRNLYKTVSFFILLTELCFGQMTYKVKEGELQFVNPDEGIVIKKDTKYYVFKIKNNFDDNDIPKVVLSEQKEISLSEIMRLKKDKETVFSSEIETCTFKDFEENKFITTIKDGEPYQLFKFNNEFIFINSLKKQYANYQLPYLFIEFNKKIKIIYHKEGFVIPTKGKLDFLFFDKSLNGAFKEYKKAKIENFKPAEIYTGMYTDVVINGRYNYYRIDTLKNKKLVVKNVYNQEVIKEKFDSIFYNSSFIVGYKKQEINIYNYTFKKLLLPNLKACKLEKYTSYVEVVQNNDFKRINFVGSEYKYGDGLDSFDLSDQFPDEEVTFKLSNETDNFYLIFLSIQNNIQSITKKLKLEQNYKYKLYHLKNISEVEYNDDYGKTITLYSEGGYKTKFPILVYTKQLNNKYNLNTIDYLLSENPSLEIELENNSLPKDLDSIQPITSEYYLVKKNGLMTYYPIVTEIKYKKLDKFNGNFTRFELPDSRKGWLSLDGKEYLDN